MIDVKEAVGKAKQFVTDMFTVGTADHVQLEEVLLAEDESYWDVTLSIPGSSGHSGFTLGFDPNRDYKVIRVDREAGKILQMKIREFGQV